MTDDHLFMINFRFDYSQTYIPHGYKEIRVKPTKDGKVSFYFGFLNIFIHLTELVLLNFARYCNYLREINLTKILCPNETRKEHFISKKVVEFQFITRDKKEKRSKIAEAKTSNYGNRNLPKNDVNLNISGIIRVCMQNAALDVKSMSCRLPCTQHD